RDFSQIMCYLLEKAVRLRVEEFGPDSHEVLEVHLDYLYFLYKDHRIDEGMELAESILSGHEECLTPEYLEGVQVILGELIDWKAILDEREARTRARRKELKPYSKVKIDELVNPAESES